ncbi:MAG: HD domain-containing protein [Pseudomonadota bacterium]|nr:HD domain-containing protein [Pseudomonadota bacterium]
MVNNKQFIEFQEKIGDLKHLKRTGWVVRGVPAAETVASHSWRMALMAMQKENELASMGVNVSKVVEMCLVHDVAEAVIGDIIPENFQASDKKISREEKIKSEKKAINDLSEKYNFPKLKSLFNEYEKGQTTEAKVVKDLDKTDMILQAYEYMQEYPELTRLDEFMAYNEKDVTLPVFASALKEIKSRQEKGETKEDKFIDFQILAGKLKHLERSGPKMYNIANCETVASHCFRTAIMALHLEEDLKEQGLNVQSIIRTAIVHDIGEAVIGDIVPEKWQKGAKISKEGKHKKEVEAIVGMSRKFAVPFIWKAFDTMERRATPEASMTKDLEIFESIQQAYEYIKIYPEKAILREYVPYHQPRIKSDLVQGLIDGIKIKQDRFLTSKNFPTFYKEGGR